MYVFLFLQMKMNEIENTAWSMNLEFHLPYHLLAVEYENESGWDGWMDGNSIAEGLYLLVWGAA